MKSIKKDLDSNIEPSLHATSESEYFTTELLYCSGQLIEQLTTELSGLQELRDSKITNRQIRLAEATAKITELTLNISDIDTIIQNSKGK